MTRSGNDTIHTFTSSGTFSVIDSSWVIGLPDFSGNNNFALSSGNPSWYFGSISFSGSQYFVCDALSNYNFGSAITVVVWHRNIGGDYRGVVSNVYSSGTGFDLRYGREDYFGGSNNGTRLACSIRTSVGNYGVSINAELNVWGCYAMTYDGSTLRSYKNGSQFTTVAASGTLGSVSNPVTIGRNSSGTEYLTGRLGNVVIYNRALSSSEIDQLFQASRDRYGV